MYWIIILITLTSGVLITLLTILNSKLASHIGLLYGTLTNYITGSITALIFLLLSKNTYTIDITNFNLILGLIFIGGIVGIFVVILSNILIPKISVVYSTLLIFLGQLFAGILIDFFINDIFSIGKLIGGFFVLAGLFYKSIYKKIYAN